MSTMTIAKEHEGFVDVNHVDGFDPTKDQPLFDELRGVLAKHGALKRFGVSLLHKHFDVYEGERLVEFCDTKARTLTLRPVTRKLEDGESYLETNWRFDGDSQFVSQRCWADCLKSGNDHSEIHKKE
jgi:hypothetical protein